MATLTTTKIISAIHQAVANARDGEQDERQRLGKNKIKLGMEREEGDIWLDSRIIDGFGVKINGRTLTLTYTTPVHIKQYHDRKKMISFMENHMDGIVEFLKKEFKTETGSALKLKALDDEPKIYGTGSSNRRIATGTMRYEVQNFDKEVEDSFEDEEDGDSEEPEKSEYAKGEAKGRPKNDKRTDKDAKRPEIETLPGPMLRESKDSFPFTSKGKGKSGGDGSGKTTSAPPKKNSTPSKSPSEGGRKISDVKSWELAYHKIEAALAEATKVLEEMDDSWHGEFVGKEEAEKETPEIHKKFDQDEQASDNE